jgi:hypothetical protein
MIWVVLDSNIYVSALVFGGNPRVILELADRGLFEVSVSDPIKSDVERVLAPKFAWPKVRINKAAAHLWALAHLTIPQPLSQTALTRTTIGYSNAPSLRTPRRSSPATTTC